VDLKRVIQMFTQAPAELLKLDRGTLSLGKPGDITVIDPGKEWIYDVKQSYSLATNTPFHNAELKGRAVRTIINGKTVWKEGDLPGLK
jgi:dihydroorotase